MQTEYFINMKNSILLFIFLQLQPFIFAQEKSNDSLKQNRILIFVNGYRGPKHNKCPLDTNMYTKDPTGYWYKYDDTIINRFNPIHTLYFNAHHPLITSVHKTKFNVATSYVFSRFCWISKKSKWVLNNNYNPKGFETRFLNGNSSGKKVLEYLKNNSIDSSVEIDIISHSMGYAFSLGIISCLEGKVNFGKMLAISPESAGYKGADWSLFDEVWQYGCNMGEKESDVIFFQDGIAPQQALLGLENLSRDKGGRIYPPSTWPKKFKGFNRSHNLRWFDWFHTIKDGDRGYFKPGKPENSNFKK